MLKKNVLVPPKFVLTSVLYSNSSRALKLPIACIYHPLSIEILFTDIDDCVNHTCGNGGSCEDGVNSYSCKCLVGFTGNHCETGSMHVAVVVANFW